MSSASIASRDEIEAGERFAFGENWRRFLSRLDAERVEIARNSLREGLGRRTLEGLRFCDLGCGSGLFSLAARQLGAQVHSLDYDPASAACARALRDRFFPDDAHWSVDLGDALDTASLRSLGAFDIVYAWGVLHHTGDMWRALDNVAALPAAGGQLFISLYNDCGASSRRWWWVKRRYNRSGRTVRAGLIVASGAYFGVRSLVGRVLSGRNPLPSAVVAGKKQSRGMSVWHDLVDWVGGYPYEVAQPGAVLEFFRARGFELEKLTTARGHGCNEFVFRRTGPQPR